jgi:hypothetical protein
LTGEHYYDKAYGDLKVADLLLVLEDDNWHTEETLVETLVHMDYGNMLEVCRILLEQYKIGHLPEELYKRRQKIDNIMRGEKGAVMLEDNIEVKTSKRVNMESKYKLCRVYIEGRTRVQPITTTGVEYGDTLLSYEQDEEWNYAIYENLGDENGEDWNEYEYFRDDFAKAVERYVELVETNVREEK